MDQAQFVHVCVCVDPSDREVPAHLAPLLDNPE